MRFKVEIAPKGQDSNGADENRHAGKPGPAPVRRLLGSELNLCSCLSQIFSAVQNFSESVSLALTQHD